MLRRPQRPDRSRFCAACQLLAAAALALGVTATIGAIALPASEVYGPPPAMESRFERDGGSIFGGLAQAARLAEAPGRIDRNRGAVEILVR